MRAPRQTSSSETVTQKLVLERFAPEETFKTKVYAALKHAIINMDIYGTREPTWIDERQLSEKLGVSRTPVREAVAMLEQEGFVKSLPRRGIMVLKKTKNEVVEMIQAWAALESMAVRLAIQRATDPEIAELRTLFRAFGEAHRPSDHAAEYSSANLAFHQTLIGLSRSQLLVEMTDNLLLHVRGIRQMTIGRDDRASRSIVDHLNIIEALERRDTVAAEQLSRDHTLGLAAYVDQHADIFE
ncbi:GntR family transcriptional regulator [Bosea caraganae]|uniref:GntR family transcriptional regulator n=1 Tax=Bosea caraganae TaxID=2763117 RepID=A0A370LC32_9HYPH|nr:GntR family transcriptional regulator [Bosea caraganae]RDJ29390.1 GntR family transcriptional regulator [Bosea caraganae]